MWLLEPFNEGTSFEEYSQKYAEICFYQEDRSVMTTTVARSEVAGLDFDVVYGVEEITQRFVNEVLEKE